MGGQGHIVLARQSMHDEDWAGHSVKLHSSSDRQRAVLQVLRR